MEFLPLRAKRWQGEMSLSACAKETVGVDNAPLRANRWLRE